LKVTASRPGIAAKSASVAGRSPHRAYAVRSALATAGLGPSRRRRRSAAAWMARTAGRERSAAADLAAGGSAKRSSGAEGEAADREESARRAAAWSPAAVRERMVAAVGGCGGGGGGGEATGSGVAAMARRIGLADWGAQLAKPARELRLQEERRVE